jgi:hypothetical protein
MKLFDLKNAGHWPTLLAAFLYFDFSFIGVDRARSPGCADRGKAESFTRIKGSDGRITDTGWRRPADLTWAIGRSCRS